MKRLITILITIFLLGFAVHNVQAASYDLIAPSGTLTRGQDVQFTINIDTQGQSLTTTTIGMSHKTDVLQYISTTPGDTFTTVEVKNQEGGKLIFKGSNPSGFSGTGTFAIVTFKLIANAPGSTELCVLFNPETPTQPPAPTSLPQTGSIIQTNRGILLGVTLLVLATSALVFYKHKPYKRPPHLHAHRKTLH